VKNSEDMEASVAYFKALPQHFHCDTLHEKL